MSDYPHEYVGASCRYCGKLVPVWDEGSCVGRMKQRIEELDGVLLEVEHRLAIAEMKLEQ